MGLVEIFPEGWLRPGALERVLRRLESLDVDGRYKKYALYEWCQTVEVEMTAEMVERVTGLPAGEI